MIKRGNKKAQEILGLSYGTIFGIIIIIAMVTVAFYAIAHFLSLNKCQQVGTFYQDFQDEINTAWRSGFYQGNFEGSIPSSGLLRAGITKVCIGNVNLPVAGGA